MVNITGICRRRKRNFQPSWILRRLLKFITISIKERNDIPIFAIENTGENIKKEFLDKKIKTNQNIKDDIKENKNLYDTKMIMFKTFGVSNDIYNEFYNYSLIIREFKNELSKIFYKHFYDILKKDFTQIDIEYKSLQQQYKSLITNLYAFSLLELLEFKL